MKRYYIAAIIALSSFLFLHVAFADELDVQEGQLTFDKATVSFGYIKKALNDLRSLTYYIEKKTDFRNDSSKRYSANEDISTVKYNVAIELKKLKELDLSWDTQNLGYVNWSILVEGTLMAQDAKIKQLEYELLILKKAEPGLIEEAKKKALASRKVLEDFLKTKNWVD